ncbi:MAG: S9 family peptidase [Chloroflexi bacterium]|nr:S9 family peptidase [Chloroflexota bacterium]
MAKSKRPLTPEDAINLKSVSDAQITPDGKTIAFTVAETFKTDTKIPPSHIWIANVDGTGARQFTAGARADYLPRWSPDSAMLAFLSHRLEDGKPQIFLIARRGGEARPLTHAQGEILAFQWSRDGTRIAFLMEDAATDDEKKNKDAQRDQIEFELHPKFARVWIADLATGAARQITSGNVHVWEFDWSPDEKEFALIISDSPSEYDWYRSRLARVSANGGEPKTILKPQSNRQLALPRWSPDGATLAFLSCLWSDRGVIAGDLWLLVKGEEARNLTANSLRDVSCMHWSKDSHTLVVMGFERGDAMVGLIDVASATFHRWWTGDAAFTTRWWQQFSMNAAGDHIAAVREDPQNPPDVFVGQAQNETVEWRQITRLNPQSETFGIGAMEKIHWKSRDNKEMQGFLVKPLNYKENAKYPFVVWVHGGPAANYGPRYYALRHYAQLLAANGFMVLLPNPRGSYGWGAVFTEANLGDLGGKDWQDILAGVDYCVTQGWVDENRLGLGGWSYGGYMTAWGITQTKRFKAAIVGAGITNWLSFHGMSNLTEWDRIANNASPYQRGGTFDKFTPIHLVSRIKTPTLILHGADDPYVPASQGYEFYRALKDLKVETELVVYPRESHGILEKEHQLDLMRRVVDWYKKHL